MSNKQTNTESNQFADGQSEKPKPKTKWRKPRLEDVSGKVMAQPYIRFT